MDEFYITFLYILKSPLLTEKIMFNQYLFLTFYNSLYKTFACALTLRRDYVLIIKNVCLCSFIRLTIIEDVFDHTSQVKQCITATHKTAKTYFGYKILIYKQLRGGGSSN